MPAEDLSASARISAAFAKLADSAKRINSISDELSKSVISLERALGRLNLGVVCWTLISEHTDQDEFYREYVGYAETDKQWRIAVRTSVGSETNPQDAHDEIWAFDDAPRYIRVKAIDKLPDLIESLVKTTDATSERLKKKLAPAQELAAAVTALTTEKQK